MFDRFTDLAKKAITMARKEAQYAQQDSIGTGHLLLGLIGGESGVAVEVLGHFGVDLKDLGKAAGNARPSGGTPVRAQLPFSSEAKAVLERTLEEARKLGHDQIGTEHLLLGLLGRSAEPLAGLFRSRGIPLEEVRSRVLAALAGRRPAAPAGGEGAFPPRPPRGSDPLPGIEEALLQALLSESFLEDNSLELTILGYLEAGGDPLKTFHGLSLLEYSVFTGSAELFEWLLTLRPAGPPDPYSSSTFLLAAAQGFTAAVRLLLARGVSANTIGNERFATPLIAASANGHLPAVEALLEGGARRDFTDPQGLSAADHAAKAGHPEIARLLRDRAAS